MLGDSGQNVRTKWWLVLRYRLVLISFMIAAEILRLVLVSSKIFSYLAIFILIGVKYGFSKVKESLGYRSQKIRVFLIVAFAILP